MSKSRWRGYKICPDKEGNDTPDSFVYSVVENHENDDWKKPGANESTPVDVKSANDITLRILEIFDYE